MPLNKLGFCVKNEFGASASMPTNEIMADGMRTLYGVYK